MKILIIHNRVRDERTKLFNELYKYHPITVIYLEQKKKSNIDIKHEHIFLNSKLFINYIPNLKKFLNIVKNYEIIILDMDYRMTFINLILCILKPIFKYKIIAWCGEIDGSYFKSKNFFKFFSLKYVILYIYRSIILKIFYPFIFHFSDAILSYSKSTTSFINKNYKLNKPIFTGTQYIDYNIINEKKINNNKNKIVIIYLGRILKSKGIEDVIYALSNLKLKNDFYLEFKIIGDGPHINKIKNLINTLKFNYNINIEILGWKIGVEKDTLLLSGDILILPTYYDSWGFVIAEGMSKGLAIVTTKDAAASELVNGENGYIYCAGDIKELLNIIKSLIDNKEKLYKMKIKSLKLIKKYNTKLSVETFIKAINSVKK